MEKEMCLLVMRTQDYSNSFNIHSTAVAATLVVLCLTSPLSNKLEVCAFGEGHLS